VESSGRNTIFPLYSMAILNQPHRLMSFRFGETTSRFGAPKNIVRKFDFIFKNSKLSSFTTNCLPMKKSCRFTNIDTDMIFIFEKTAVDFDA